MQFAPGPITNMSCIRSINCILLRAYKVLTVCTVREFNWWPYCICSYMWPKFSTLSLYLTKLFITKSFAIESSVAYSEPGASQHKPNSMTISAGIIDSCKNNKIRYNWFDITKNNNFFSSLLYFLSQFHSVDECVEEMPKFFATNKFVSFDYRSWSFRLGWLPFLHYSID